MNPCRTARAIGCLVLTVLVADAAAHAAARHFHRSVARESPALDFEVLDGFDATAASGEFTVIRMVTTAPDPLAFDLSAGAHDTDRPFFSPGGDSMNVRDGLTILASASAQERSEAQAASGQRVFEVVVAYAAALPGDEPQWALSVRRAEGEASVEDAYFGFVVDSPMADLQQARQEATKGHLAIEEPGIHYGDVHYELGDDHAPVEGLTLENLGTAPLTLQQPTRVGDPDAPAAERDASAFAIIGNPAGETLLPGEEVVGEIDGDGNPVGLVVRFQPTELRTSKAELRVPTADAGTATAKLSVTGVALYGHLLYDVSGSMSWRPDGSATSSERESRIYRAKQAGRQIVDWIDGFSGGHSFLGMTIFPNSKGTGPARTLIPVDELESSRPPLESLFTLAEVGVGGLQTTFAGTPMQAGLETALQDLVARKDPLGFSADREAFLRKAIVMLSDGAENAGSNAASVVPDLTDEMVRLYTVGLGTGSNNVNHPLLEDLAADTQGEFFPANLLDAPALLEAFKLSVSDWLGLALVEDPRGSLARGESRQHTVCIDDSPYALGFEVNWDAPAISGEGIALELVSPDGTTYTPDSEEVLYTEGETYASYVLREGVRGGQARGQWRLELTGGDGLPSGRSVEYSYNVLAQTRVRPKVEFPWEIVAGQFPELAIAAETVPRKWGPLDVEVELTGPTRSFQTFLAEAPVEREWVFGSEREPVAARAVGAAGSPTRDVRRDGGASIAARKWGALLERARKREEGPTDLFDAGVETRRFALRPDRKQGAYVARSPALEADGSYRYLARVRSPLLERYGCLWRDLVIDRYVAADHVSAFRGELLQQNTRWIEEVDAELFFDPRDAERFAQEPPEGRHRRALFVKPRDEHGNLLGVDFAGSLDATVESGELVGIASDWMGGAYLVVDSPRGETPRVTLGYGDVSTPPIELDEPWPLWWILLLLLALAVLIWTLRRAWAR